MEDEQRDAAADDAEPRPVLLDGPAEAPDAGPAPPLLLLLLPPHDDELHHPPRSANKPPARVRKRASSGSAGGARRLDPAAAIYIYILVGWPFV